MIKKEVISKNIENQYLKEVNIENPETLGLTIIKALTTQIDGTIQINTNPGTTYKITFKEQRYRKRT